MTSPPPPHTRSPHTGRMGNNPAHGHAVARQRSPTARCSPASSSGSRSTTPRTASAFCASRRAGTAIWSPSSATPPRSPPANGSPPRANGSTTAPMASSSRRASCAPRRRPPSTASRSISVPGMIRGIGPVYAKKMVKAFGEKVFDIIEAEPDRLREVDRHRPDARQAHHRRLGRAEDRARDHGLPAQPWRRHGTRGSHLQDLRRRCRPGHDREPVSAGARHPRHRLQDRRRDRHEARHREDGDDPGARRDLLRADRGDGRGPLRLAHRGTGAARRRAARGPAGAGPDRAGSRTGRGNGDRGHGRRDGLRLPRRPVPGRAGHCRAAAAPGQRNAALALHRPGEGAAVDRAEDRLVAGREPGRRDPAGPAVEGPGHHRRTGRRQDDHRQLDPAHPGRQGREPAALRADRPGRQAHDRSDRVRGQDHSPAARGRPQERAASNAAATTRSNATCWSSTRPPWSMSC